MSQRVIIIGSGMGGLTAAIRLAQGGCSVTVLEARDTPGGLAASVEIEGFQFDAGPYILLDRAGLEWAFQQLGMRLDEAVALNRIQQVYQIRTEDDPAVCIFDSLERTADELEINWPGCGDRYRRFIRRMQAKYTRLQPLQWRSRPDLAGLARTGAWREIPFLLRSLQSVLGEAKLPKPITTALGIWTHVAGQTMAAAPSPVAMVPAVIHTHGAYYPTGGIGAVPAALCDLARKLGVSFQFSTRVRRIRCEKRCAVGVETEARHYHSAEAIVSDVGLATYLDLLDANGLAALPRRAGDRLAKLPLQSPGVCAYLAVTGKSKPPYLKFRLQEDADGCRLLITPGVLDARVVQDGWMPARLLAPMHHGRAESGGGEGQREFLQRVLAEDWWRQYFDDVRVLATRIPSEWGRTFHLFRNSMNPVMTADFMRAGRLAHRSPWVRNLYLTGSATHPGQWVSFCAVSGVLTANRLLTDLGR